VAKNPNARYIVAGSGVFANGGRNTLPLRPIDNFDLSLFKNFNVTERWRLQFGAQFYNFLNHPQFVPGFTNRVDDVSSSHYTGAAARNFVTPGTPIFNQPEQLFSSNPRFIQLGLKLLF
jgi:hypothetical protein